MVGRGEGLKTIDQWIEELSKQVFIRSDEEDVKVLWRMNEIFDDDFEDEE